MRRLVKADQHPVHQMAGSQYQHHREPNRSKVERGAQCSLIEKENGREDRESRTAYPMGRRRFGVVVWRWGGFHPFGAVRVAIRRSGERQASASTALNRYDKFSISASRNRFTRKSQTISSPFSTTVISHPR